VSFHPHNGDGHCGRAIAPKSRRSRAFLFTDEGNTRGTRAVPSRKHVGRRGWRERDYPSARRRSGNKIALCSMRVRPSPLPSGASSENHPRVRPAGRSFEHGSDEGDPCMRRQEEPCADQPTFLPLRRLRRGVRLPLVGGEILRVAAGLVSALVIVLVGVIILGAAHRFVLLSRTPPASVVAPMTRRQTRTCSSLLLQPVHHVLDRLELAGRAGRRRGQATTAGRCRRIGRRPRWRRPRTQGPATGCHSLEGRAVRGRR